MALVPPRAVRAKKHRRNRGSQTLEGNRWLNARPRSMGGDDGLPTARLATPMRKCRTTPRLNRFRFGLRVFGPCGRRPPQLLLAPLVKRFVCPVGQLKCVERYGAQF